MYGSFIECVNYSSLICNSHRKDLQRLRRGKRERERNNMKQKPWGKICLICSSPKTLPLHACFIDLHPDSSFHRFTYYFSIPTNSIKNLFTHLVADVNSTATFHVSYSHTYTHTLSNTCPATVSCSRARTLGGGAFAKCK